MTEWHPWRLWTVPGYDYPLRLSGVHAELLHATPYAVEEEPPAQNASKQAWADYAVALGNDPGNVARMTRAQLIENFG